MGTVCKNGVWKLWPDAETQPEIRKHGLLIFNECSLSGRLEFGQAQNVCEWVSECETDLPEHTKAPRRENGIPPTPFGRRFWPSMKAPQGRDSNFSLSSYHYSSCKKLISPWGWGGVGWLHTWSPKDHRLLINNLSVIFMVSVPHTYGYVASYTYTPEGGYRCLKKKRHCKTAQAKAPSALALVSFAMAYQHERHGW